MDAGKRMLRALIVEDSPDDASLLVDALQCGGFDVSHERVDTLGRLEVQLKAHPWDIVLCDHNLPGFDAPHALQVVRRHHDDVPFIIVSGGISDDIAVSSMKNGAADFIPKDNLCRLVPAVERELKGVTQRYELMRAYLDIQHMTHYDPLTGLPNREHFASRLKTLLGERCQGMALAHVELCRSRHAIRTFGSSAGRKLLLAVAMRLAPFSADGVVARVGEDCLAFVADRLNGDVAAKRFGQLLVEAFHQPFQAEGQELFVYCRLGISPCREDETFAAGWLEQAETAAAYVCDEGRGGYALYEEAMNTRRQEQLELESALYRAVRNQEFELHYQPQMDLTRNVIVGVEALLRWNRPGHGLVSPAQFIPLLEENSLIVPVGEWVLRTACQASREWQRRGMAPVRMAVNLSAIQFRQPGLLELVKSVLAESGLEPTSLELEITESVAIFNEQETIHTLRELGTLGVKLAIDDFGTGYSSLNALKRFPFGKLKIDQTFVRDILRDANGANMVKAILDMAASLGLDVIAEGVETLEQADFLQDCGCHEIQGYYFSRPIAEPDMQLLLQSHVF
jgi:EAL domain-containing protein (putative c-di-GMP-specific phosphodiesterase class I)/GGDEF domain-containing protein/CheY-like chemotaxis protein